MPVNWTIRAKLYKKIRVYFNGPQYGEYEIAAIAYGPPGSPSYSVLCFY